MTERVMQRERGSVVGGRYELVVLVGVGGMGEVWRARDRRLGRVVAVKLLAEHAADRPGARRRIAAEARAACVSHPHIVAVYDFGEEPTPYIVMELLDGRTLADDLARGPLPNDDVKRVGDQVLDALSAAHARGLLHRDLKPGNVLWAGPSRWKVGDFGIAASISTGRDDDTTVPMMGTRGYMAPERIAGAPPSVADDLFAVGMLLRAAAGDDADGSLRTTIAHATAVDPVQRFASADAMRAALRGDPPTAPERTVSLPVFASHRPRRRSRARAAAIVVLTAALAGGGGLALVQREHDAAAPPTPTTVATTTPPTTLAPVTTAPAPLPTAPKHGPKDHKHPHPPHGRGPGKGPGG